MGEKAKAYIQKKKAEKIAEIKNSFKDKLLAYEAVNAANRCRLSTLYLQSGGAAGDDIPPEEDNFTSLGDGRAARMFISCNLLLKQNISYSFLTLRGKSVHSVRWLGTTLCWVTRAGAPQIPRGERPLYSAISPSR